MRIATFNVENLFLRAAALSAPHAATMRKQLQAYQQLTALLERATYTPAVQARVLALLDQLGLIAADESALARLRQNHGRLLRRGTTGVEVVARGRTDWTGWLELKREDIDPRATHATARVIADVNPDVLAVVEAESRLALPRFNELVLAPVGKPFAHVRLMDGNDPRGIDVGLCTRARYPVTTMETHVDDRDAQGRIFGRDCAVYGVRLPSGHDLVMLVNHFKSKGYGHATDTVRLRQARRVRAIVRELEGRGHTLLVVAGDLNDLPDSAPLRTLRRAGLRDASEHARFTRDPARPGTYGNGTASGKIDYLLLSPALFERVKGGGIWRKGVWGGKNGTLFPHYPEITRAAEAASDHACLWVDLEG